MTRFSISFAQVAFTDSDQIAEYNVKRMDIDANTLNIPTTEYDARVTLPSAEFTRFLHNLSQLGESVRMDISKEGVRFTSDGWASNGTVFLRNSDRSQSTGSMIKPKTEEGDEEQGNKPEVSRSKKKEEKIKKEKAYGGQG